MLSAIGDNEANGKSCVMATYQTYLQQWSAAQGELEELFDRPSFFRRRYRTFLGRQSSQDKLLHRLKNTFGGAGKELVVMCGNWGRTPNLRHQPPTPGIGLRRYIHKQLRTYTVDERSTSSFCPCCESGGLGHPRSRLKRVEGRRRQVSIHHLLCCPNTTCAIKWWQRDILAVLNIKKQALHMLRHGAGHPLFKRWRMF